MKTFKFDIYYTIDGVENHKVITTVSKENAWEIFKQWMDAFGTGKEKNIEIYRQFK
jgi:hypothetical protein